MSVDVSVWLFSWCGLMVRNAPTGNTAIVRPQCLTYWFYITSLLFRPRNVTVRRILSVKKSIFANFDVFSAVFLKIMPFWDMTSLMGNRTSTFRRNVLSSSSGIEILKNNSPCSCVRNAGVWGMDYSSTDSYTRHQMPLYTRGNIVQYSL
jgi:hypothetical protein